MYHVPALAHLGGGLSFSCACSCGDVPRISARSWEAAHKYRLPTGGLNYDRVLAYEEQFLVPGLANGRRKGYALSLWSPIGGLFNDMSKLSPIVRLQRIPALFTGGYPMFPRSPTRELCCIPSLAHGASVSCVLFCQWGSCVLYQRSLIGGLRIHSDRTQGTYAMKLALAHKGMCIEPLLAHGGGGYACASIC